MSHKATSRSMDCGHYVSSIIFKVLVGPAEQIFFIHKDVLSLSPILRDKCSKNFSTDILPSLTLREDPATEFRILINYLYRSDLGLQRKVGLAPKSEIPGMTLARVYFLAHKYQVPGLEKAILDKISTSIDLMESPSLFYEMARELYTTTPECGAFRLYCQVQLFIAMSSDTFSKDQMAIVNAVIFRGGAMAQDVHISKLWYMQHMSRITPEERKTLEKDLRTADYWKNSLLRSEPDEGLSLMSIRELKDLTNTSTEEEDIDDDEADTAGIDEE